MRMYYLMRPQDLKSLKFGKLYDFQQDAVLAIINKLENFNGCILADSVGLGKTLQHLRLLNITSCEIEMY